MEEAIQNRLVDTRRKLLENFDEDVHDRLRLQLDETRQRLDWVGRMFWKLSKFILGDLATFDDATLAFDLAIRRDRTSSPAATISSRKRTRTSTESFSTESRTLWASMPSMPQRHARRQWPL